MPFCWITKLRCATSMPARLEKYLIADEVELEDVTEQIRALPRSRCDASGRDPGGRYRHDQQPLAIEGKDLLLPATLKNAVA